MPEPAIEVRGLHMAYGDVEAVRGIDLEVGPGELLAVLGPNGAGKTSTVEHLEGYRPRTAGVVTVLGADPSTAGRDWRARIGVVLQESLIERELSVREVLMLYAGYHASPRPIDEVIALVGLTGLEDRRGARLSGGQQRRVDVALALIGDPELVFLDEPTTGFDPAARRATWEMIEGLSALGKTIVLTTHYLEEAERLADRIAVVVAGRIVAEGTAAELRARGNPPSVVTFSDGGGRRVETHTPARTLHEITEWALAEGLELRDLEVRHPTLEDAYLSLIAEEAP